MRTVAARRSPGQVYDAADVITQLRRRNFSQDRAERILEIAGQFGIKAEVRPGGGVVTVQRAQRGKYTITDGVVLL